MNAPSFETFAVAEVVLREHTPPAPPAPVFEQRRLGLDPPARWGWLLGPALLVFYWAMLSATGWLDPRVLPAPWTAASTGLQLIREGRLQENLAVSATRAGLGLLFGTAAGVALALVSGLSQLGGYVIDGVVQIKRGVPILALIPFMVLWFGIGEFMKTTTIAVTVFFPIYIHTHSALRAIDIKQVELAETVGLSRLGFLRHVVLGATLPGLLLGLRFGVTASWLALVVVEQVNTTSGIGYMVTLARNYAQSDVMLVGLVVYAALGLLSDAAVRVLERRLLSWPPDPRPMSPVRSPVVRIRGLTRRFTLKGVLNGLDLDVRQGEFVAILGRSGSGKSTLLRAVAGLDHEAEGEGEIVRPERLAVVFQDARLLPWKRALDNVMLGARGPDARQRAIGALAEVELAGREQAWPHELSGGEQQRVALARALIREPQLLLADEPFGALDALTRIRMHHLLRRLSAAHDPAVLLVTHDVDEAIELADRIVLLEDGRLAADAPIALPRAGAARREAAAALRARFLALLGVQQAVDA